MLGCQILRLGADRFGGRAVKGNATLEKLAQQGAVVSQVSVDGAQITLTVPGAQLSGVVRDVLAALPVIDLTVEDPPLEEVMRELFRAQPKEARGDARAPT